MKQNEDEEVLEDSVTHNLVTPIKYGAENLEAKFVEVSCPSLKSFSGGLKRYKRNLKALVAGVLMELAEKAGDNQADNEVVVARDTIFPGDQMLLILLSSLGENFSVAAENFSKHIGSFCKFGGEDPIQTGEVERMNSDDIDMLFALFVANFILPLLMKNATGK